MLYALLGLLLLGLVWIVGRWYASADPHILAQGMRAFVAAFAGLSMTGLLFAGRLGLALVALGASAMAVRSMLTAGGGGTRPEGRTSDVSTDTLRMTLDHATGEMEGEVLAGAFAGRRLNDMGVTDLAALFVWCRREDPPSAQLLQSYLDRRDPDWQSHAEDARPNGGQRSGPAGGGGPMDEATALAVLGLSAGCGVDEIKAAHRRLMGFYHPDRGGSDFLAAQINQAKDLLLKRRRRGGG